MITDIQRPLVKNGTSFLDFKRTSDLNTFPQDFARYVRSHGEVYFWEKGGFHVVTSAQHAREVLSSPLFSADRGAFFISRMPKLDLRLITDFFGVVRKMMVMSDDGEHNRRRKLAAVGFEDHVLERFSVTVKKTIEKMMEELRGVRSFEFVEAIAKKLPSTVLADLFSIPEKDRMDFFNWSNTMTAFFGGASEYTNEEGIEVNHAAKSLKTYFHELLQSRREAPGEDYVSLLLSAQSRFAISDEELVSQLIMMLVAGQVTTTDQINNIMYLLATRTELQEKVRRNPALMPVALEELKRIDPAVTFIFRVAREATFIGAQQVAPGDVIFISTHAVNRDLPEEQRPDEIDLDRKAQHFAYGHGPHYCLGAKLGRMQMLFLFEGLLKNFDRIELDQDRSSERDHYSLSFSGFKRLYLKVKQI